MEPNNREVVILMADDDADDRAMAAKVLSRSHLTNAFYTVADGEELIDYLHHRGKFAPPALSPTPGLILLDLNMPRKDGREALAEIKASAELRRIPVVVMTTSKAEEDVYRSYDLGASSFICKPFTLAELVTVMKVIGEYWFQVVKLPDAPGAERP
ncbi:MAG: response regulator receiver protein [Myxococcaceae bacterium]|nr:response regulator receiver protein [Myxococcaceae bacterium]